MSYTALYRKFRPAVFADVKGQEHIVTTLKNQIISNRIGHAYLFCGTRGTGKTTIAKIFAKAVNCIQPIDGSPCGECASCKAIAGGNSMNVIEIDAASNNGVENIRQIIEEVSYSPVDGRYKVYIIDEVHMLSIGAFNALLKTLEEPPEYVIFILATTEVHKIPITILSRCQRYDFKRISIDTIAGRLRELVDIEGMQVEEKALRYIAKAGDGSMRDALSLLDQCLAFHYGENLTYDMALEVLGSVDTQVFSDFLRSLLNADILGSIDLVEEIILQGRELTQFVTDFTWYLRNLMLLKASTDDGIEEILDVSTEHLKRLREEAEITELGTIIRYIRIFSELSGRMKYAAQKRISLEMTIVKVCKPEMESDTESLKQRVQNIETKIENGIVTRMENINSQAAANETSYEAVPIPKAIPEDIQTIIREWHQVVAMAEPMTRPYLNMAKLSMGQEGQLLLCYSEHWQYQQVDVPDKRDELYRLFTSYVGKEVSFEFREYSGEKPFDSVYPDLSKYISNMPIEEE